MSTLEVKPREVVIEKLSKPDAFGKTKFFTHYYSPYTPAVPYPHTQVQIFHTYLEQHVETWKSRGFDVVVLDKVRD